MVRTYFLRHPIRTRRALEILPGFFSWSLILFPFWGSFLIPTFVAYYVIIFAVYWLYRSAILAILSVVAHFKLQASSKFDWVADLEKNFPKKYNPLKNLIWNDKNKKWMNHKLFGKVFDYLYPELIYEEKEGNVRTVSN